MEFTKDTKLKEILKEYPWLLDEAIKMNPKFKVAKTPIGKAVHRHLSSRRPNPGL